MALWHAHQPDGPALPERVDRPCTALVTRARWQVEVVEIDTVEAKMLNELAAGASFGTALDAGLASVDGGGAAPDIGAMLQRWFRLGVFAA